MHKYIYALIAIALLLTSCSDEQKIESQPVDTLSQEVSKISSGSDDTLVALVSQSDISDYFGDSLVGDISIVDCTLSAGTNTQCYKFTVAPDATRDHEIGPWCPRNISENELSGGIWPDDGQIYEVSGAFVENLAVFYSDDSWNLYDTETGTVNVTDTQVSCEGAAKPDVEDEYKNHCVECSLSYMDEIPNVTYTIPMNPEAADNTQSVSNTIGIGVSFNGTKFDASAPTQQILAANTIAPFDDCGGHINLNAGYHYHETTGCSKQVNIIEDHETMIGFAFDGFPMFSQAGEGSDDLDTCGGHSINDLYHYHVAETGSNEFLGCYSGEYGCASEDPDASCDASVSDRRGSPGRD